MLYCSIPKGRICEKRGFLNGFLCPIYGHGALLVLYLLHGGFQNPVLTFIFGAIVTSILEYFTSWIMESSSTCAGGTTPIINFRSMAVCAF